MTMMIMIMIMKMIVMMKMMQTKMAVTQPIFKLEPPDFA